MIIAYHEQVFIKYLKTVNFIQIKQIYYKFSHNNKYLHIFLLSKNLYSHQLYKLVIWLTI